MPSAVYGYVDELAQRGVAMAVLRDCSFYTIGAPKHDKPKRVASSNLFLAPELLLDEAQMQRLERTVPLSPSRLREVAAMDLGRIYVFRVYEDVYEIDWELTTVPRSNLESLLFAAHKLGKKIACRLVAPKTQRNKKVSLVHPPDGFSGAPSEKRQLKLLL